MGAVRIRDAQANDGETICAVTLAAYKEYAAQMGDQGWALYQANILETLANVPPAQQIVAELADEVVGAVLLYPATPSPGEHGSVGLAWPYVRLLAVTTAARGRGIGAALMAECVARARRSGAAALALHSTPAMQAAMHIYQRMGFERFPEIDISPAPGFTIFGYRLVLAA